MSAPVVNVLLEEPTSRARYAVEQILTTMLGWEIHWVRDASDLAELDGPRMIYGHTEHPGALCIRPAGYLSEQGTSACDPTVVDVLGMPALFPVPTGHLPFDPFSGACFLLARHDEIAGVAKDGHGRPLTRELHGARHGYLHRPIVDEWAMHLAAVWKGLDPEVPAPRRAYRQVCTVDLDNGFKFLGRPLWRNLGSAFRDLLGGRWQELLDRWAVMRGSAADPFDIYAELRSFLTGASDRVIFFVLCAPRGRWDHAIPVGARGYAERLRELLPWAEVGVHPGYDSSDLPGNTTREIASLVRVTGSEVVLSRQHFLRMRMPETLRHLETIGIREEHSMGLHDLPGFRAGTCTPYPWYDLQQERRTGLIIHPFAVMDNTLRVKLGLSPQEAIEHVLPLIDAVKRVQGTFTGLWHESFLGRQRGNEAWRETILKIMEKARP